jgi:hypothetical protein
MEFVNFVEVVLDDDDDEGTEASNCSSSGTGTTSARLLFVELSHSLSLSLLSLSLSLYFPREIQEFISGKNNFRNSSKHLKLPPRALLSLSLSLSLLSKEEDGNTNENKNSLAGGTTFVAFKIVEKEEESE